MGKAPKFKTPDADGDVVVEVKKPSKLVPVLLAVVGLLLGGGGATAYFLFLAPNASDKSEAEAPAEPKGPPAPPEFVEINRLTVPLINPEGSLSGYMNLDLKFEVKVEDVEFVKARIPMMRHAINETLSRTSVADKGNPLLLDYPAAQRVLRDAVNGTLGRDAVRTVQITTALPI
ncbi:MAG TPA: flagellar basal body-associated FliL family protein [Pedomonas sp.]|uniref:flagellar basal body-associated FliL family protein n=1 Tax=Pedomonas sp. TaxID=2976421 RepID=UPI002F3FCA6A